MPDLHEYCGLPLNYPKPLIYFKDPLLHCCKCPFGMEVESDCEYVNYIIRNAWNNFNTLGPTAADTINQEEGKILKRLFVNI